MDQKKLYRTEGADAKIFGVCGGLAEYFDLDPTIARLGMVALALLGVSAGFWIYLIAALIIPKKSTIYPGF